MAKLVPLRIDDAAPFVLFASFVATSIDDDTQAITCSVLTGPTAESVFTSAGAESDRIIVFPISPRVRAAFAHAIREVAAPELATTYGPASARRVSIDDSTPLATIFETMAAASVNVLAARLADTPDTTVYLLRTLETITRFWRALAPFQNRPGSSGNN